MLFLLAVAVEGWSVVSAFAAAATILGTVKLGLETVKKYQQIQKRKDRGG